MFKIIVLLCSISFSAIAQLNSSAEFKNQGEQEIFWAKQLFEKSYSKQKHKPFKGKVDVSGHFYTFKDRVLQITNSPVELEKIVSKGILNPGLLELEFMIGRTDTVNIYGLEEVSYFGRGNSKYKRFKFLAYRNGLVNPTVYFFELNNEKATNSDRMAEFISGSSLSFFIKAWTQI